MSSTVISETNSSSFQRNTYEEAIKHELQKCRMMEKEVAVLRDEIENTRKSEEWCKTAGERALQELKKLRVDVPETETEWNIAHGENLHLYNKVEQLGMTLQKEIIERDHWKQNIMDLREDLEMLELKKMQDMASIEQTRFMQLQSRNMAEQFVINNNTIKLENQNGAAENDLRVTEINAAKKNIMFFESERNSLLKHVTLQNEVIDKIKEKLNEVSKENDELNRLLDIERDINPYFFEGSGKLSNPLRQVPGALKNLGRAISERRINSSRSICLDGTSLGFGDRSRRKSVNLGSNFSVKSAPQFKFNICKNFERKGLALGDSLDSISENENSL